MSGKITCILAPRYENITETLDISESGRTARLGRDGHEGKHITSMKIHPAASEHCAICRRIFVIVITCALLL